MKKTKIFFLAAAAFAILLSSCANQGDNIYMVTNTTIAGPAKEENTNFETRSVPFLHKTDSNVLFTLFTRIYNKNEYVPYAGVRYWLQALCQMKLESPSYSDGEYTIVGYALDKTFPIVVNTKNNTIYCSAWAGYLSPDPSTSFGKGVMIDAKKAYDGQRAVTFDLGKYGFKIYAGIDDAYAPVCVLNQLFACALRNMQILYNGKNFYYPDLESNEPYESYESLRDSPWYKDENGKLKNRPKELIEASYNLLCFAHDNLYGKPGYYGFADDGNGYAKAGVVAAADALSFDAMLTLYDPDTKALLKSSDYADYLKGLAKLTYYTYGDQHANVKWSDSVIFNNAEIKAAVDDIEQNGCSGKWKFDRKKSGVSQTNSLNWWRKQKGIIDDNGKIKSEKTLELIDGGKTLIIRFDGFSLNQEGGWNDYYENATAEPDPDATSSNLPNDTVALFYKAFYNIKNKKTGYENVKTVLIDDSCNGGGAKPVMQYILYLITGNGDLYYDDVHTGAKNHEFVKADLNLDGKIDYKDSAYRGNFFGPAASLNVAILTSFDSFSCGNALPFYAKERGVKIIGERSGGGSCIVGKGVTADGFPYNFSVNSRLSAQDFSKTVEGGAEVDKSLLDGDSYEKFYTNSVLIDTLKELFGDKY